MRINIYQIDGDKDTNRVKFDSYRRTLENGGVNPAIYKCVFHGDVEGDLEDVYTLFNFPEHPGTYQGHSLSVSDVIEVIGNSDKVEEGRYFVDSVGFKKVDFDSSQCAEMEGKIIAVWGSPHSGKTTFATKLATAIYSSFESTVITVYTDLETPVIPVLFPFDKTEDLGSVGYPLSKTEVEQGDIINNLVTVKDMQNFGFLGYKTGENKYTYPKFGRAKAEDLLTELCRLADYVIVDCTSNLDGNVIAQTAIEKADQILRLSSPDLQSISFFLSQLPVYGDSKFRLDDHIVGLNTPNVDVFMPIEEAKTQLGEVSFTVPFSAQVKEQMQQGKLHVKTSDKRFEARMQDIASKVVAYGTD